MWAVYWADGCGGGKEVDSAADQAVSAGLRCSVDGVDGGISEMTTATGIKCPHCRHEMVVNSRGFFGLLVQVMRHLRIRECRRRGGRTKCGNCGRQFVIKPKREGKRRPGFEELWRDVPGGTGKRA